MPDTGSTHHRRWAPEWIAVLTLAVAIIALGGGLFASLNAMEGRISDDMRAMENGIREDMRAIESGIREEVRELRGDVGTLRERVSRLEVRFDEEFPPRAASVPLPPSGRASPPRRTRL